MCRCFFAALLFLSVEGFAQPVSCDLSLSDNHLENAIGGDVNANLLVTGQVVRLRVVIGNFVSGVTAPGGHFRLRIGLGNGFVLNNPSSLSTAPLSNYFNWTYDLTGAQPQIVGNSIAALPDGFAEYATFEVKATNPTTSTVSFNLLISNPPSTTTPLSDPSPANNTGSNTYSIVAGAPLPVAISSLTAVKTACDISIIWRVENQLNLRRYEVEASKDNILFEKIAVIPATNTAEYGHKFSLTSERKTPLLYIRLKSIDIDGSYRHSKTVTVPGTCAAKWQLALFPNPVSTVSAITVQAKEGAFDGVYNVSIVAANGQLLQQKQLTLSGVKSFSLPVAGLPAGKYHVRIFEKDEAAARVLDFEKL